MGIEIIGIDLDGPISLLPFGFKQVTLTSRNKKIFWQLQKFRFLQRFYNYFFRIANPEIRRVMRELKERGFGVIIISAEGEPYRQELEKWLLRKRFYFDRLYLKPTPEEGCLDYKKRMAPLCNFYFDDKIEIVNAINNGTRTNGKCLAFLYRGQKKEEVIQTLSSFLNF